MEENVDGIQRIVKLRKVEPNKRQPRKIFEEESLRELAVSIQTYGMIQPILVRQKGTGYEIIAGERRWRAARMAGLKDIPVIIKDYGEQEVAEIALVENLQRENLNPLETARAYQTLQQDYHMTQEELARKIGKSRSVISNTIRFLRLPESVQQQLAEGRISEGHAKVLLGVKDETQQCELAKQVEEETWSVRALEEAVKKEHSGKIKNAKKDLANGELYEKLECDLSEALGSHVTIKRKKENTGSIEIDFYSIEDLERVTEILKRNRRRME